MTTTDAARVPDFARLLRLDGKAFIVIGAGQGMGRMTCHALTSQGARVLCVDIVADRAKEIAEEVGGVPYVADARVGEEAEAFVGAAIREFGRLDGIADIVGMARWDSLVDMTEDDWDWSLDTNLRHAFHAVRFGARAMMDSGGGSMVFVASVDGISSAAFHAGYGAGKAGLLSLVRTAATELHKHEIRVNAVVPGTVATPRMLQMRGVADMDDLATGSLADPARTWDVASAILFLSSGLAAHITGQALAVDGGALVQSPFGYTESPVPTGSTMGSEPTKS